MRRSRKDLDNAEVEAELLRLSAAVSRKYPGIYPSIDVRSMAESILGKPVSDKTFQRWRLTASVQERSTKFTAGEAIAVWGIAFLKRQNSLKQVTRRDLTRLLSDDDWLNRLDRVKTTIEGERVRGDRLPEVLGCSESWLYQLSRKDRNYRYGRSSLYDSVAIAKFRQRLAIVR